MHACLTTGQRLATAVLVLGVSVWTCTPGFAQEDPETTYEATYASLAQHETPTWYEDAKLGIFIHWGIYSVGLGPTRGVRRVGSRSLRGGGVAA